ncbi:MAG UNVERIFIED_CONTAM: hypothetical protein LVR29_27760 [Microcystis novacekii LVE1205-3]|jgi:hypothetical protein
MALVLMVQHGEWWSMVKVTELGFQGVINTLKSRLQPWNYLLIHTNNHGWYDAKGGFLSAYGGIFYASDFDCRSS